MNRILYFEAVNDSIKFQQIELEIIPNTYLVIYASGYESPTARGGGHDAGSQFEEVAKARDRINKEEHPEDNCVIFYCPTDIEFFDTINMYSNIKRLDVYSHGWLHGMNLGGFTGMRTIGGVEHNSNNIDWDRKIQDSGRDLRRVEIHEDRYLSGGTGSNELIAIDSSKFMDDTEVYFWGCNIGGQLDPSGKHIGQNRSDAHGLPLIADPKESFAQYFAVQLGKGSVFALVGKGVAAGSMFKIDENGRNYYDDGEMLPANISYNHNNRNTKRLKAVNYMKKFPL